MHTLLKPRNCGINKLTGGIEGITELAKIEELCVRVGLENTCVYQTLLVLLVASLCQPYAHPGKFTGTSSLGVSTRSASSLLLINCASGRVWRTFLFMSSI